MINPFVYFSLIGIEFIFIVSVALYMIFLLYSSIMGSPYVPSKEKEIREIFDQINWKKNWHFLDLGCGDGRAVRIASKYVKHCVGIDINPIIIFMARLKAKFYKVQGLDFRVENIFKTKLQDYDVIYIFLMPEFLKKLRTKLKTETKRGAILISHGFKIEGWEKYCYKTLPNKPFPTYYYRLSKASF